MSLTVGLFVQFLFIDLKQPVDQLYRQCESCEYTGPLKISKKVQALSRLWL